MTNAIRVIENLPVDIKDIRYRKQGGGLNLAHKDGQWTVYLPPDALSDRGDVIALIESNGGRKGRSPRRRAGLPMFFD